MFIRIFMTSILVNNADLSFGQTLPDWVNTQEMQYFEYPDNSYLIQSVTDNDGNTYLIAPDKKSGFPNIDTSIVVVFKINSSGILQWKTNYDGYYHQGSFGRSIDLDDFGNILIAGVSTNHDIDSEYATILKLDFNGNPLWDYVYLGKECKEDVIVKNGSNNSIYLGFNIFSFSPPDQIILLKFDYTGNLVWQNSFNDSIANYFGLVNIAVDSIGNLISVINRNLSSLSPLGISVLQYAPDGQLNWRNDFPQTDIQGNPDFDIIQNHNSLAISPNGNIYIAASNFGGDGFKAIKIDGSGQIIWNILCDTCGEVSLSVTLDHQENCFLTGLYSTGSGSYSDYSSSVVKFDSNGAIIWKSLIDSYIPVDAIVDIQNNCAIVFLQYNQTTSLDILTMKFDVNGNILWSAVFNKEYFQIVGDENPLFISVDPNNNFYVTGVSHINNTTDFVVLLKYGGFTGVNEIPTQTPLIFPNPFSEFGTVLFHQDSGNKYDFLLYNSIGKEVIRIPAINNQCIIERKNLPSGFYFYKILSQGKIRNSGKVIIE